MRALLLTLLLATTAFAQPQQPGDVAAPVVKVKKRGRIKPSIGLAKAVLSVPEKVKSGTLLVLDITGTSEGDVTLHFWPSISDEAVKYDTGKKLIYVSVHSHNKFLVPYSVTLRIESGGHTAMAVAVFNIIPEGDDIPPPIDAGITKKLINKWLASVPESVRSSVVTDPVTNEKYTRQQAVGKTFSGIGAKVEELGSVRAANVMLTNGLATAFGDSADKWEPFAEFVDKALEDVTSLAKYGQAISLIGETLQ
ncbi:hypothetical protein LCGC14_0356950 [marine sediment metagenome]|uniref:Uncharacterized protein n=1 Tax=marine sediment metagenome TaxID=412755 RepID=A0A0F9VW80_9ZZZZ